MKLIIPKFSASSAALLAGWLLVPVGLQAAQLAYEGFDYPAGFGNTSGQSGGSGWGGVWQTVNNGSADLVTGSLAAGGGNSPTDYEPRSIGNGLTSAESFRSYNPSPILPVMLRANWPHSVTPCFITS